MPNSAPGAPVSTCTGGPTKPPGNPGDTSISKLLVAPAACTPMSPLPTTRSPFFNRAALMGVTKGAPWAMTRTEVAEGPVKLGTGVGVVALHWPAATMPSFGTLDTPAMAITLAELESTTYRVSLDTS